MAQAELTLINKLGLHARAAAVLVKVAGGFAARVRLRRGDQEADGKSIMAVMMLAAPCGTTLTVMTEGEDADEALAAIEATVADRFGEDE